MVHLSVYLQIHDAYYLSISANLQMKEKLEYKELTYRRSTLTDYILDLPYSDNLELIPLNNILIMRLIIDV